MCKLVRWVLTKSSTVKESTSERSVRVTVSVLKPVILDALEQIGKEITAGETVQEIYKDRVFFEKSGGGVTISGGEPLLQPNFTQSILNLCKDAGIHTAVDTAGNVPWKNFEQVLPYTDLFLYDLKCIDPEKHLSVTGSTNQLILEESITTAARKQRNLDSYSLDSKHQ